MGTQFTKSIRDNTLSARRELTLISKTKRFTDIKKI